MDSKIRQTLGLPSLTAFLGILLSFIGWYVLRTHLNDYFNLLETFKAYLPSIFLYSGILFSLLLATIVRMSLVAKLRTATLNQANVNLKKEIGDRLTIEETKQKLEVALLQGQKLQAMGTLAGGIAHDFNNILYAIIGYTEMSREDVTKDSQVYKNLGKVLEASHRGQELISRILSFSRRQHHTQEIINLNKTIEAALSLLRPTIPASVIIHYETNIDANILGNQTQIHQIVVNLINNAVDAMDGEGAITIELTDIAANDAYLNKHFPRLPPKNYYKIAIKDTGHGMDQATIERIFEPFFTTKEVGKGTGLGLSIVHTIIQEHQGEITVHSQLGQGTTIEILLPQYKGP